MPDEQIMPEPGLVAHCGLYCGACKRYLNAKCEGCHANAKANWCKIRLCCLAMDITTCAECPDFQDPRDCTKFNNFMSKFFALIFRSDRAACIAQIKELGLDGHAKIMAEKKIHTIKR